MEPQTAQQDSPIKRASQRVEDLRGYCRIAKSQWDEHDEVRYMLGLIENRLTDTLKDLAHQLESK